MLTTMAFSQYTDGNTVVTWSKYKWEPIGENPDLSWDDRGVDVAAYHSARNPVSRQLMSSMILIPIMKSLIPRLSKFSSRISYFM